MKSMLWLRLCASLHLHTISTSAAEGVVSYWAWCEAGVCQQRTARLEGRIAVCAGCGRSARSGRRRVLVLGVGVGVA